MAITTLPQRDYQMNDNTKFQLSSRDFLYWGRPHLPPSNQRGPAPDRNGLPPCSRRSTRSSFSPSRSASRASSTFLRDTLTTGVFGAWERIVAQIVLRFAPAATSNQAPPKNPLVRREFKVFSRFFPVLRE